MTLVDEARKLLQVREIIDLTHFTGVWRGQAYECRALPDTSRLSVGDAAFCHVLPGNTELVAVFPPAGEELWFSPGVDQVGFLPQVWYLLAGSDVPVLAWTGTNAYEYVTNIAWCKGNQSLYVFTWQDNSPPYGIRVYKVNRTTKTLTMVASHLTAGWGDDNTDPIVDVAEFDGKLYGMTGGYLNWGNVWEFNPATNALALFRVFPELNGFGFGIACNAARDTMFASDGRNVYSYTTLGGWVYDVDLFATFGANDNMAMLTDRESDLCYHGLQDSSGQDATIVVRDNATGNWSVDLDDDPPNTEGVDTLCNLYTGAALEGSYGMAWGWNGGAAAGTLYRKAAGGAWVTDGQLPYTFVALTEEKYEYALATQGVAAMGGRVYMLTWHTHVTWNGAAWVAEPDHLRANLWRRTAAGTYTLLWQSAAAREFLYTVGNSTGMARAAATAHYCHEEN